MNIQTLNNKPISPEDIERILNNSFTPEESMPSESLVVRVNDYKGIHNLPVGIQGWQNPGYEEETTYDLATATILDPTFYATGSIHNPEDTIISPKYELTDFFGVGGDKTVASIAKQRNGLESINAKEVQEILEEQAESFLTDYQTIASAIRMGGKSANDKHISTLDLRTKGQLIDIRDNLAEFRKDKGPLTNKIYSAIDELVESKHFEKDFTKSPMYQPLMTELAQLNSMYKE
ncbi:MAG: hypothetical protein ACMXYD_01700 [Candidatus Woesearchaeota archaeon]